MNTYLTVSSLFNFTAAAFLLVFVSSAQDKNAIRRLYLAFVFAVTGWSGAYFLWQVSSIEASAFFYCKVLTMFSAMIPITLYHFCLALAGAKARSAILAGYVIAGFICVMTPFGFVVEGVVPKLGHRFWPDPGILGPLYIGYFVAYVIASGVMLIKGSQKHIGRRASDQRFVFYTCLVGFIGGGTNFPLWYDIPIQPYGNILVSVYVFLLGIGLYNQRMRGIGLDFYKAWAGVLLNFAVALFYLLFLALYRTLIGDPLDTVSFWMHGAYAFIISAFVFWGVPRLKLRIEKIMEDVFRRERDSAIRTLSSIPAMLSELAEEDAIASETGDTILVALDLEGVAFLLKENFSDRLTCKYVAGKCPGLDADYYIETSSALVNELSSQPECLLLDQGMIEPDRADYSELVDLRNAFNVSVIVPVFAGHEVYGLILIRDNRESRFWSEEESSILLNIGAQIGLNFRARDYERRSSEVDKLVALGTMAAGLAHEIRNPLVSVQTLASFIQSGKDLRQVPDEFQSVILRDIRRIQSIVDGVSLYSQNQQSKKAPCDIAGVVEASVAICQAAADASGVAIQVQAGDDERYVLGNFDQLSQVFNNLIENAVHALEGRESSLIQVRVLARADRSQRWVDVTIKDNGPGVPNAIIERIFDPFITSKDTGERNETKGMGLGLAISKRIIENHNGVINVGNNDEGGATFTVSLRCLDFKKD